MVHRYEHHARADSEKHISGTWRGALPDLERISRPARATGMVHVYALDARATSQPVWLMCTGRTPGHVPRPRMVH
jgi:hypothetical protein